jgi:hypothetical protein
MYTVGARKGILFSSHNRENKECGYPESSSWESPAEGYRLSCRPKLADKVM